MRLIWHELPSRDGFCWTQDDCTITAGVYLRDYGCCMCGKPPWPWWVHSKGRIVARGEAPTEQAAKVAAEAAIKATIGTKMQ